MDLGKRRALKIRIRLEQKLVFEGQMVNFPFTLGKAPDCDIALVQAVALEPHHLRFEQLRQGTIRVVELVTRGQIQQGQQLVSELPIKSALTLCLPGGLFIEVAPVEANVDKEQRKKVAKHSKKAASNVQSSAQARAGTSTRSITQSKSTKRPHRPIGARGAIGLAGPEDEVGAQIFQLHPGVQTQKNVEKSLEVSVFWRGQLYGMQSFRPGQKVLVGGGGRGLWVPSLKYDFCFGEQGVDYADFTIPHQLKGYLFVDNEPVPLNKVPKLIHENVEEGRFRLKLNPTCRLHVDLGRGLEAHFRHIPSPEPLTTEDRPLPEQLFRKTLIASGAVHLILLLIVLIAAPRQPVPKIQDVPERVARLLVTPPEPPPPPPPPPPPEIKPVEIPLAQPKVPPKTMPRPQPKQVVQQPQPKRPQPKQVVVRPTPKIEQVNRVQAERRQRQVEPPRPAEPKVEELGALAALAGLSKAPSQPMDVSAININREAGGAAANPSTSDILKSVQAPGGKRPPGGGVGVQTTGKGVGSGEGYGVSGLQGKAGTRGVVGAEGGTFELAAPRAEEGLTREAIMAEVRKHLDKIQRCYEQALLRNNSLEGQVEYEWHINPNGRVESARVLRSTVAGGDALNSCVTGVFRSITFPRATNGQPSYPRMNIPFRKV